MVFIRFSEIDKAMQRIDVKQTEHYAFLKQCEDNSYDVVYLDPMGAPIRAFRDSTLVKL